MAEGALFSVVGTILGRLTSPAFKEIGKFLGLKNKFKKLENTMASLEAVIGDADAKRIHYDQVKHWLERLEDAVDDVDNLLDEFQSEALQRQVMPVNEMTKKVRVFFSNSNQIAFRVKMGLKLKNVRETLNDIKQDSIFGTLVPVLHQETLTHSAAGVLVRETHSFVRDEEVVGRDADKMNIIQFLLDFGDSQGNDNVSVLPIVGMGGLGKTTLAQYVFNDDLVQKYFEPRMWVCISDVFDLELILKKIIESIDDYTPKGLDQLQNFIRQKISKKRFLLVLDDVWNDDREKWLKLKTFLMDGSPGSMVLITTRNESVAQVTQTIQPYCLKGLDGDQSWSLFKKMAFERGQEPHNSNIINLGKEIVEKCKGVPLSIRAIGSTLYGKKLDSDWLSFKNNELAKLPQQKNNILPTLKLSYDCLPSHLKHCFAYCRVFPKDHKIDVQKLIKLWIAQGFVKSSNQNECLEDNGYGYFIDLLWRSFFHEVKKDYWGTIKTCKMHDLMHDLAISVAGVHNIMVDKNTRIENFHEKIRHLSFDIEFDGSWKIPPSLLEENKVRTFLLPKQSVSSSEENSQVSCDAILSNFNLLRALDLKGLFIKTLPNSFDKARHLRYLDLSSNKMKELPSSITRLHNLQTLILTDCSELLSLPRNLKYMINLRHLLIEGCWSLTCMPGGLGELTSLQTLDKFVMADNDFKSTDSAGFAELCCLNKLRGKLVIMNLSHNMQGHAAESKAANLQETQHLECLTLEWNYKNDHNCRGVVENDQMLLIGLQPHLNLKALEVNRYMGMEFATWLSSLSNLVSLNLSFCENLQYLPLLFDQSMTCLEELKLFCLTALEYVSNGDLCAPKECFFPSLEKLTIMDCPNLKGWWKTGPSIPTSSIAHQNQPIFPCLLYIGIYNCPKLSSMPLYPNVERMDLERASLLPLQQTALLMLAKAIVSPSSSSPLASTASSSNTILSPNIQSSSPPPHSRLNQLLLSCMEDIEYVAEGIFCHLSQLEYLHITDCPNLACLPEEIANLSSLKSLDVSNCVNLISLPEGIRHLSSLKYLSIRHCYNLEWLPEGISNLSSLVSFTISTCPKLASLPDEMHCLTSLLQLEIQECPLLSQRIMEDRYGDRAKIAHIPYALLDDEPIHYLSSPE